jgi:drug/metabolite transporter (DMT)-like permease
VSRAVSLPRTTSAVGAKAPAARPSAWQLWTALWIIYIVWGSTYLAIRVMVETVPPLLGAGVRFALAGVLMLAFLAWRGGRTMRPTRAHLLGCLAIGILLPGANAVVTVAETDVPSGLAALLVAVVPLIVIVLRKSTGEGISKASIASVVIGFAGVAALLLPGEQPDGASIIGMLAIVGAAVMWAGGSFASPRMDLPSDPFVSTGWQMLLGGLAITVAGLIAGETGDVDPSSFSMESVLAFAYLVLIGSLIAFTAYIWLLQNAPVSKVATYAYVNPVIAIFLGWLILDETITEITMIGAAVIVASVAVVVRTESRRG